MPYLRTVRTALVRKTPLGTYLGFPHDFMIEAFTILLEIDESAEMLLRLCDGTRMREQILQKLAEESGEPVEAIADGFDEFVEYLVGEGVLEWREEPSYIEPLYNETRPFSLTVALTNACNLQCSFCAVEAGPPLQNELTLDDIVPLVEQIKRVKPTPFAVSGGEPLLKKELVLSMFEELCPIREMSVSIFTNATLVTRDYAQQLYDAGLRLARVSVDGHTEQVHDALRGKGTFRKTMQGIKYLRDVGIHVDAAALICRTNYPYLSEIRAFVKEIADSYAVTPVYPMGKAIGSELLLSSEERFKVRFSGFDPERIQATIVPRDACIIGLPPYVRADGDIFPCFYMQLPEFKLGNIRENDLCEIYRTELMRELLGLTLSDIEGCRNCDIRYFCGGACRGSAYRVGKSLRIPDPIDCEVYKALAQKTLEKGDESTREALEKLIASTREMK